MTNASALTTGVGVRVVDELLAALLATKDRGAVDVQRTLLNATIHKVGPDDLRTWLETYNLGTVLAELGAFDEAERIFRDVLAKQEAAFGANATDAARTRRSLARLLAASGRLAESEALERIGAELEPTEARYEPLRHPFRC